MESGEFSVNVSVDVPPMTPTAEQVRSRSPQVSGRNRTTVTVTAFRRRVDIRLTYVALLVVLAVLLASTFAMDSYTLSKPFEYVRYEHWRQTGTAPTEARVASDKPTSGEGTGTQHDDRSSQTAISPRHARSTRLLGPRVSDGENALPLPSSSPSSMAGETPAPSPSPPERTLTPHAQRRVLHNEAKKVRRVCGPGDCYSPSCSMQTNSDGAGNVTDHSTACATDPAYVPGVVHERETRCVDAPQPSPLPLLLDDAQQNITSAISNFKHLTGRPFANWYEWKGDCEPPSPTTNFGAVEAVRDNVAGVFRFRNVCLKPIGPLSGYRGPTSHFDRFTGRDDVATITGVSGFYQSDVWLNQVEALTSPPQCLLNTKLLIVPIILRSNNPGHVFQRMAALLDIRERAFPGATAADVTIAFVANEGETDALPDDPHDLSDWNGTAFPEFTTVVAHSHFFVFGRVDWSLRNSLERVHGPAFGSDPRLTAPVCFQQAAVYLTCFHDECAASREDVLPAGSRPIIPLYYRRDATLLQRFADRMRSCAAVGLDRRPKPNASHPTVLLATRSATRKWVQSPFITTAIGELTNASGGQLAIIEMREHSILDLVKLYSSADIVIGPYGAGLFYSIFMPPGAVAVETNLSPKRCAIKSGLNQPENRHCDYGGNFWAAGVHHLVTTWSGAVSGRQPTEFDFGDFDIAPEIPLQLLSSALCILRASAPPGEGNGSTFPTQVIPSGGAGLEHCVPDISALRKVQSQYLQDADGTAAQRHLVLAGFLADRGTPNSTHDRDVVPLARLLRENLDVVARLKWLRYQVTKGLDDRDDMILRMKRGLLTDPTAMPPGWAKVLVVTPCGRTRKIAQLMTFIASYIPGFVALHTYKPTAGTGALCSEYPVLPSLATHGPFLEAVLYGFACDRGLGVYERPMDRRCTGYDIILAPTNQNPNPELDRQLRGHLKVGGVLAWLPLE